MAAQQREQDHPDGPHVQWGAGVGSSSENLTALFANGTWDVEPRSFVFLAIDRPRAGCFYGAVALGNVYS